jgi:hypothetical protein
VKKFLFILGLIIVVLVWSCSKEVVPTPSVTHPEGWSDVNSAVFHGEKVRTDSSESCIQCHGADYKGGNSGVSCYQCHGSFPHPAGWTGPASGHATYLQDNNWSLNDCQNCHGDDYQGGSSGASCLNCHTATAGPEACNTCHGNMGLPDSSIASWAPPEDLGGHTATSAVGVGAHQQHMPGSTTWTTAVAFECGTCHTSLSGFDDAVHIDSNSGIDIHFGSAATWNGAVSPQWTKSSASCAGVYCHGNFQWIANGDTIRGNNPLLVWNQVGSGQAACGTCHGIPPTGHIAATECNTCHGSVVDADKNIIDKSKHINGLVDLN